MHPDFWHPDLFRAVLRHLPSIIQVPDGIEVDEWALRCPDIEAAIKCLFCFLLFWTAKESSERFTFEVAEALPLLNAALDAIERNDSRFGTEIGAKVRGDALEEMIRVCGLLTQFSIERMDSMDEGEALAAVQHHAIQLMHVQGTEDQVQLVETSVVMAKKYQVIDPFFHLLERNVIRLHYFVKMLNTWLKHVLGATFIKLVRMLKLKTPGFQASGFPLVDPSRRPWELRLEVQAITEGPIPVDERQQDTEWITNLFERLPELEEPPVKTAVLMDAFRAMVEMPLEEQRYRLECLAVLVPRLIHGYADQLKQKTVPPELADLKTVMNSVLQDEPTTFALELLEEVSSYPCLLDFTTKRAMIHAQCDRVRLTQGSGEPVRIVVPRDNVLDGVCSTLNLQDAQARIDVPLEIEFRAGYSDDTGNEMVEDGEDQGGPRRQWMDRACRYFIASDLFMSPSEDAAHLEMTDRGPGPRGRGRIVVPSPEPVCQCVQEDWTEQFELFGCVIGFAILHKETIPVHFGHNFLRSVFGLKTDTDDLLPLLEQVDKTLHTKLTYILGGSYRDLGDTLQDVLEQSHLPQTFVVSESHCQELVQSTPLIVDGESMQVTEDNKERFVHLLLDRILVSGVAKQVQFFQRGLLRVVPNELVKEIELMLCGADGIDVDDWEKHTEPLGTGLGFRV
ncbi:UPL2 [Symbiodinium natans]|uniref:HECT-type E3 ubiquitin transferase n=1 Tax=Symbiodinium natans TaxID=878477 RepID=A0A812QEB7_9DINO|nr:UPL2 [Symbiodinium natans]